MITRVRQSGRATSSRHGMALLFVLLLLSLTLGLSYAAMRSQSTAGMIQRNADRRGSARQAAITGLTMAMKKMQRSDWTGVGTSHAGSLSANESFLVTYTSGDTRLSSSDAEQPYRVTLLSTGYAADPNEPANIALYRVRAVVRFIPRKLADDTTDWQTMMNYTVYQWSWGGFTMAVPARIEGPVRIQAIMNFDWDYNWWGTPRNRFHTDLEKMRQNGRGDYRPFNGPVTLRKSWQFFNTVDTLNNDLGVTVIDASFQTMSGMTFPSALSTYKLYPGGKEYAVPLLPQMIQSVIYQPDPATNPAGLFFHIGSLDVGNDTTIRGTVVTAAGSGGRISVAGKRVRFEAVGLPSLYGTSDPIQLPVAMVADSFQVAAGAEVTINGLVTAYNSYEVLADNHTNITLAHQGKLIAQSIYFNGRSDWYKSDTWWNDRYAGFHNQENNATGIKYFPEWLKTTQGLDPNPRLTIKPDPATIRYHWHNPQNTIYVAGSQSNPNDHDLRWDLLDWEENP